MIAPPRIVSGKGAYVWDVNDKQYLDFLNSYGAVVIGHADLQVNQAIIQQLERGILLNVGQPHPLHDVLSRQLLALFPSYGQVIYSRSGSEATTIAVRIARAITGKPLLIRCGYHGWHDWAAQGVGTRHWSMRVGKGFLSPALGIPEAVVRNLVLTWDGDDRAFLEEVFQTYQDRLAGLILAPEELTPPIQEKLQGIRDLCTKYDVLFILDEVKTAFRVALGGVQELYGITADITTLSKALSNGYALAATLVRDQYASILPSLQIESTYQFDAVAPAAALKVIELLKARDGIAHCWKLGSALIDGLNEKINAHGFDEIMEAESWMWPPMPFVRFKPNQARRFQDFYRKLLQSVIVLHPAHMNFISLSHTRNHIEDTLHVCETIISAW